jgi:hypothetical protein
MPFGPEDQLTALEALEHYGVNLTVWEEQFIEDIRHQMDAGRTLTPRQVETLEAIYAKRTP